MTGVWENSVWHRLIERINNSNVFVCEFTCERANWGKFNCTCKVAHWPAKNQKQVKRHQTFTGVRHVTNCTTLSCFHSLFRLPRFGSGLVAVDFKMITKKNAEENRFWLSVNNWMKRLVWNVFDGCSYIENYNKQTRTKCFCDVRYYAVYS